MRRSVREALVGFSLLAAIAGGVGLWLWLKGISVNRGNWSLQAHLADAAGLAERSPVSFRGVQVGNVRKVRVGEKEVVAELELTDPTLRLPRPVVAMVGTGSLLAGDAVVSLVSTGQPLPPGLPGPRDPRCDNRRLVCNGGSVAGASRASLESVTEKVEKLLEQANRENLVPQLASTTRSFEITAKETEKLTRQGQQFVREAQQTVRDLNAAVAKADPILANLNAASADAAKTSRTASRIAARLDNPRLTTDLGATLANAKKLTDHWQAVGGDVGKLTGDPKFISGIRSVSVGLGKFFEELYPAQVDAVRARQEREEARRERASAERRAAEGRFAPRSNAPAMPTPAPAVKGL